MSSNSEETLLHRNPNLRNLIVYQKAKLIYALNNCFMKMYDVEFHRTEEQMVMASRSGKQNILEGMNDYATSVNSGLHLLNIARGSLVELQEDYEDYLLRNNLQLWDKNDIRVLKIRELGKTRVKDINFFSEYNENSSCRNKCQFDTYFNLSGYLSL